MKSKLSFSRLLGTALVASSISLPAQAWLHNKHVSESKRVTITELVAQSGGDFDRKENDYDILLNAVVTAGLDGALADKTARFTVFAPTDKAFIKLARDLGYNGKDEAGAFAKIVAVLTELGNGDPIPVLTNVLLYHVSPGEKRPKDVLTNGPISTLLEGATILPIAHHLVDNDPEFDNPKLQAWGRTNQASNGVILPIDRVLIPVDLPAPGQSDLPTITGTVAASGGDFDHNPKDFDLLLNAVLAAGLEGALADPASPLTVFAPNDGAFIKLARDFGYPGWDEAEAFAFIASALTELGGGKLVPVLTNVLLYHVAPGSQTLKGVLEKGTVETLLTGASFDASLSGLRDNAPALRDPRFILRSADLLTSNGRIHVIDRVLIPVALP